MPSMHVASAFMLMLFAGPSRWLRVTSILFLIGTAFGTVLGEHYFVDWAGAIAFACFAASVGLREKRRAAIYFAATLAWLFLIRFAGPVMIEYPVILQLAVLAIVALGADATIRAWDSPERVTESARTDVRRLVRRIPPVQITGAMQTNLPPYVGR